MPNHNLPLAPLGNSDATWQKTPLQRSLIERLYQAIPEERVDGSAPSMSAAVAMYNDSFYSNQTDEIIEWYERALLSIRMGEPTTREGYTEIDIISTP